MEGIECDEDGLHAISVAYKARGTITIWKNCVYCTFAGAVIRRALAGLNIFYETAEDEEEEASSK